MGNTNSVQSRSPSFVQRQQHRPTQRSGGGFFGCCKKADEAVIDTSTPSQPVDTKLRAVPNSAANKDFLPVPVEKLPLPVTESVESSPVAPLEIDETPAPVEKNHCSLIGSPGNQEWYTFNKPDVVAEVRREFHAAKENGEWIKQDAGLVQGIAFPDNEGLEESMWDCMNEYFNSMFYEGTFGDKQMPVKDYFGELTIAIQEFKNESYNAVLHFDPPSESMFNLVVPVSDINDGDVLGTRYAKVDKDTGEVTGYEYPPVGGFGVHPEQLWTKSTGGGAAYHSSPPRTEETGQWPANPASMKDGRVICVVGAQKKEGIKADLAWDKLHRILMIQHALGDAGKEKSLEWTRKIQATNSFPELHEVTRSMLVEEASSLDEYYALPDNFEEFSLENKKALENAIIREGQYRELKQLL